MDSVITKDLQKRILELRSQGNSSEIIASECDTAPYFVNYAIKNVVTDLEDGILPILREVMSDLDGILHYPGDKSLKRVEWPAGATVIKSGFTDDVLLVYESGKKSGNNPASLILISERSDVSPPQQPIFIDAIWHFSDRKSAQGAAQVWQASGQLPAEEKPTLWPGEGMPFMIRFAQKNGITNEPRIESRYHGNVEALQKRNKDGREKLKVLFGKVERSKPAEPAEELPVEQSIPPAPPKEEALPKKERPLKQETHPTKKTPIKAVIHSDDIAPTKPDHSSQPFQTAPFSAYISYAEMLSLKPPTPAKCLEEACLWLRSQGASPKDIARLFKKTPFEIDSIYSIVTAKLEERIWILLQIMYMDIRTTSSGKSDSDDVKWPDDVIVYRSNVTSDVLLLPATTDGIGPSSLILMVKRLHTNLDRDPMFADAIWHFANRLDALNAAATWEKSGFMTTSEKVSDWPQRGVPLSVRFVDGTEISDTPSLDSRYASMIDTRTG
jgi:DNA-binding CsgD family transcriptional regulator